DRGGTQPDHRLRIGRVKARQRRRDADRFNEIGPHECALSSDGAFSLSPHGAQAECGTYRIPARKKLWMKARWKTRNAIISGAEVISAAAQITDQSTPWSTEANTCRPTVTGRFSTELVTISGHRKLFQ